MKNKSFFKNQADFVIYKCGGQSVVAEWLKIGRHVVWGWVNRSVSGYIPSEYQAALLRKARENGIDLSERDLIFPPIFEGESSQKSLNTQKGA